MSSVQILMPATKKLTQGQQRAEKVRDFEKIQLGEQHMLPSRLCLFHGRSCVFQQDNAKPHTAAITTAWLRSRRVWVLNWPACSPDLSLIEKMTTNSSAAGNLYGPNSNTKTPETRNIDARVSSNCFEKRRRCYTMVNMPLSQLFWDL